MIEIKSKTHSGDVSEKYINPRAVQYISLVQTYDLRWTISVAFGAFVDGLYYDTEEEARTVFNNLKAEIDKCQ